MNDRRDFDDIRLIAGGTADPKDPSLKDLDLKDLDDDLLLGGPGDPLAPHDPLAAHDLLGDDPDMAPRRRARKSSAGSLFLLLILVVVGGGGAFAYLNKDLVAPMINDLVPGLIPVASAPTPDTPQTDPAPAPVDPAVAVVDPNAAALPPAGTPLPGDGVSVPPADGTVPPLAADMPPQPDMTADASAAAIAAPILADGQAQPTTPTTGVPGADPTALPVVDPLAVANPASASVDSAAPLPNPSVVAAPSVDPAATVAVNTASAPVAAAPSASAPVAAATVPPAPADLVPAQVIEGAKAAPPSADGLVDLKAEQEKAEKAARDAAAQLAQEQEAAKKMEKAATTSSSDPSDVGDVAMPDLPDVEKAVGGKEDFIESTTDFEDLTNATQRRLQLNPEQKAQGLGVSVGEKRKASTKPASPMKSDDGAAPTAEAAPAIDPEAKIAAANRALDLERYQAAFDMFDELYATNQRDERILMGRAVALQKLDRVGEAIQAYDELIALNPNNPDIMINALGLVRKQNPTEALSRLLTLRQKYPTNATVAAQVGLVNAELKNYEDGLRYLNIAADLESTNPKHYFNMAVIAERMARPDLAVRYYEQALKADALAGIERNKLNRDLVYDRLSILRTQLPVGEGGGF